MDTLNIMPKRREALAAAIPAVTEALQYGLLTINKDGSMVQRLATPVVGLTELTYKPRLPYLLVKKAFGALKQETGTTRTYAVLKLYTGKTQTELDNLEAADTNIAESIALFFI